MNEEVERYDLVEGFLQPYPDGDYMLVNQHQRIVEGLKLKLYDLEHSELWFVIQERDQLKADNKIYRDCNEALRAQLAAQTVVPDAHDIAIKVRAALDRFSCPDAYMRIAYEAVVAELDCRSKGVKP
jgi:hypothetical protein